MKTPCDEGVISARSASALCTVATRPWILAATILGSSMAFIDGTVVNIAVPTLQQTFHATVVDVQWVVESYGIFLSSLILAGGALGDLFGRRRCSSWASESLQQHQRLAVSRPAFTR